MFAGCYHDLLCSLHADDGIKNGFNGHSSVPFAHFASILMSSFNVRRVIDFGSGVSSSDATHIGHELMKHIAPMSFSIEGYEPYWIDLAEKSSHFFKKETASYDAVISFDVLEHLHQLDAAALVPELFRVADLMVVANISCIPAIAKLKNGKNAHTSVFDSKVWSMMFLQESIRTKKPFALFTTVSKESDQLIHNIPYEKHFLAFTDGPFQSNSPFHALKMKRKVAFDGSDLGGNINAFERWRKSHIASCFEYVF